MGWREKFNDHEGVGTCDICAEHKPLYANRENFAECHSCWLLRFVCMDCGINTRLLDEYYTLNDKLWRVANPQNHGMLCIGCLESRIKRTLTCEDFSADVPINDLMLNDLFPKSTRLIDRLSRRNLWTFTI